MITNIEVLHPSCNPETVRDGRGGIFTWTPPEPILEFSLIYYTPGRLRGLHYHDEFIEYLLIVDGEGALVWPNAKKGRTARRTSSTISAKASACRFRPGLPIRYTRSRP